MGKMTKDEVVATLRESNPTARQADLALYADAFLGYQEAQANISSKGWIVAHPRTGAPIDNPYLRVRARAVAEMARYRAVRADRLWGADHEMAIDEPDGLESLTVVTQERRR